MAIADTLSDAVIAIDGYLEHGYSPEMRPEIEGVRNAMDALRAKLDAMSLDGATRTRDIGNGVYVAEIWSTSEKLPTGGYWRTLGSYYSETDAARACKTEQ